MDVITTRVKYNLIYLSLGQIFVASTQTWNRYFLFTRGISVDQVHMLEEENVFCIETLGNQAQRHIKTRRLTNLRVNKQVQWSTGRLTLQGATVDMQGCKGTYLNNSGITSSTLFRALKQEQNTFWYCGGS